MTRHTRAVVTTVSVIVLLGLLFPLGVSMPRAAGKTLRIAMVLWRGETEAEKGFRDGLKEQGHSADYVVMNANQDRSELGRLLREDLKSKLESFDYVYAYGTTVTLAAKTIVQDKVPVVFNIVADPVGAGLVKSLDASGGNIAGVTNEVPLALQLQTALQVGSIRRLGILFNPREKNSMLVRDKLAEVARPLNIEVVDLRSPPAQDMLQDNLRKLRERAIVVDAVYLPPDSFIVSNAKLVAAELRAGKVRSIASLEAFVEQGAFMGVVADYYTLGRAAAGIVHRHQGGQQLSNMPLLADPNPVLKVNSTTARALGITLPEPLRKRAVTVE
jgi:putative ABC transport system substrate-binding protein